MKITKNKYKELKKTVDKLVSDLATLADANEDSDACRAFDKACEMQDAIDDIGLRLNFLKILVLDTETGEK